MPAWILSLLESLIPTLLQGLVSGLGSHPQVESEEIQAKLEKHQAALDILKKA